ncbi:dTDP-glucose 4,6-dehydratase [Haloferula sp. A504]|uniref:dTDP-glucose 4,6-dehydratase n=1 Tax=Haloferula sp. A504 TaxID=3373601 RepID=UPI0031C3D73A|nr:dTDP-glucose 4,6-dehydratase [Verrucomicrobiaceae bacterium E54]
MRLLVTGGSGFIGSNLVRLAIGRGHQVLNLDKLTYAANPASLTDLDGHPGYHFLQADIADADAVRAAFSDFQPESLIHLAAETHVDRSIDDPGDFIQTNVTGTSTLLQAARDFWLNPPPVASAKEGPRSPLPTPRFLHLSTDEVFGSLGTDDPPFTESSPYAPRSPYSASKAAADHLVRAWSATYGLPATVVHPCNIYGPCQFPEKLIPLVILKALRGETIPIYGDGRQVRDWLHVDDLAEALLLLLERGRPGQSYNLGGGHDLPNLDLVTKLLRILDDLTEAPKHRSAETSVHHVPDRPGHDFRYALDSSKARTELGWQPRRSLDTGLRQTVEWYLDHESWWRPLLDQSNPLQRRGLPAAKPAI